MEPPKKLIVKILESCFMLALSAFLINVAVHWLLEVRYVLIAAAAIVTIIVIIFRIWKHRKDKGQW